MASRRSKRRSRVSGAGELFVQPEQPLEDAELPELEEMEQLQTTSHPFTDIELKLVFGPKSRRRDAYQEKDPTDYALYCLKKVERTISRVDMLMGLGTLKDIAEYRQHVAKTIYSHKHGRHNNLSDIVRFLKRMGTSKS